MQCVVMTDEVTLVCKNELIRKVDRQALKLLGYMKVTVLAEGAAAVEHIVAHRPSLVVTSGDMDDMDACELTRQLRRAGSNMPPVVVLTSENREQDVLDAITAGCGGYVLRPYNLGTIRKHLEQARSLAEFTEIELEQLGVAQGLLEAGDFNAALEEYEEVLTATDEAQRYFNQGIKALGNKKYGQAIIAFNKALRLSELYGEAYKGMAEAYKGKGDMGQYEKNLNLAAEIFAQQDRFDETKQIFADILKIQSEAINPYNSLGVTLRKKGDFTGSIQAYKQALALTPEDENIHYNIAKACYTAGQEDKAKKYIEEALNLNPEFMEARRLLAAITGKKVQAAPPAASARAQCSAWKTVIDE